MNARQLEAKGYKFTGDYSSEYPDGLEKMKQKAAEWRAKGYFATVVSKIYEGRVTSAVGHSVYAKPRHQNQTKPKETKCQRASTYPSPLLSR